MNTINLKLYDTLKKELGLSEEKSRAITQAIEEVIETDKSEVITKFYLQKETAEIRKEIAEAKADMIKWMFLFWASSIVATLGGLLAIVKFMVAK